MAGSATSHARSAGPSARAAYASDAPMRETSAASAWRSWLPAMVSQRAGSAAARAISHCTVSRGHRGPEAMSPRLTTSPGRSRSISAHTHSSAGRLPWMSETMAMREVVIWRDVIGGLSR